MISDYLEQVVDGDIKLTSKGDQVHCNCPFCGDTRMRLYISTETDQVYCHNCGQENKSTNGSFVNFIMGVEGCSYDKAFQKYKDIKGTSYIPDEVLKEIKESLFRPDASDIITARAIPLPDEYTPLSLSSKNLVCKRALHYLMKTRKVSWKQIKEHKMGFCVGGEYANRIIIPIMEGEHLRFWVARAIGNGLKPKEKSPSNEFYQISKSQVIFNIYNSTRIYGGVVLAEGIFDALSFGDIGGSLLGKVLYGDQLTILLDYYNKGMLPNGVYVALDNDAFSQATRLADELYQYMPVKVINIPKKYDDPNNFVQKLGRKELMNLVDESVEYDESYKVKRRLFIM